MTNDLNNNYFFKHNFTDKKSKILYKYESEKNSAKVELYNFKCENVLIIKIYGNHPKFLYNNYIYFGGFGNLYMLYTKNSKINRFEIDRDFLITSLIFLSKEIILLADSEGNVIEFRIKNNKFKKRKKLSEKMQFSSVVQDKFLEAKNGDIILLSPEKILIFDKNSLLE